MRREQKRSLATLVMMLAFAVSVVKCGDDSNDCQPGLPCPCAGARGCVYDCPEAGCMPQCHDVDFCSVACGAACSYQCHNTRQCGIACGSACNIDCHDVADCQGDVGSGSSVSCHNLNNCNITCRGSCEVECRSVSSCSVNCASGSATNCGDGRFVCDRAC